MAFTPFTITGGGNQSRGDNGYWNVSKMVLLSELAAHLESGRLAIINTPTGQELIPELNSSRSTSCRQGTCGWTCDRGITTVIL